MGENMDENTNKRTANIRLPESFGDRISFLRKLKELTQAQLAEKLGISAQAVSKWESGLSCPDIMMLVPLADIFGVSTDVLLAGGQLTGYGMSSGEEAAEASKETLGLGRLEWQAEVEWQIRPEEGTNEKGQTVPEDVAKSENGAMPEDVAKSENEAMPEGGTKSEDGAEPESVVKSEDGAIPEGAVKSEDGAGPEGRTKSEDAARSDSAAKSEDGIRPESVERAEDEAGQKGKAEEHTGKEDAAETRSQFGQGEQGNKTESGYRQSDSDRRKWQEDWKNGTLEVRKVFRENNVMIHSLHNDIGMEDAIIREGDEYALDLSCYPNGDCREEVRDGVWNIKDRVYQDLFLLSNITNIFSERKVIIIIPRGYHFKDVKIKLGAGKLVGRGILTDASSLDLGAGEIILADYYSGAAKVKCGMGKVMLEGQLRGRCKLDCGMGEIAASLVSPSEYGYRVKVGMGDVRVGDNQFGGMGGRLVEHVAVQHHIGAVRHKHVGYILAAAGQDGEQASRTEIVGKMLHKRPSGQVAVAANHQLLHPVQPGAESLETFGKVACRAVGHADDIRIARLAQRQHIPFPFGDNQARNILFGNQQRVDTVDVVRRARRGGRILAPTFGIAGSSGVARAVLHVDGLPVDIVHIGDALVHHPRSVLFILSVLAVLASEAAVHQAADTRVDGCFQ